MSCHEGKKLTCCLTIYNRQDQESIDRIKLWYIPLGTLLSHRKKEIMPFAATWMDLDIQPARVSTQKGPQLVSQHLSLVLRLQEETRPTPAAAVTQAWMRFLLPCNDSSATPSSPSQLEWKIGLPWANTRGSQKSPS